MEVSGGDQKKYNTKFCFLEVGDQHGTEFVELGVRVLPSPCGTLKHLDWNSVKKAIRPFRQYDISSSSQQRKGRHDSGYGLYTFARSY